MNKGDVIIYACVIIGAGIGLALGAFQEFWLV